VALLTAPAYYAGAQIVGFVAFSSFLWGLSNIAFMGIAIKKQTGRLAANQVAAAAAHIGLQLLLVPRFGYVAAAISALIGYGVLLALQAYASRPHLTWRFPFGTLRNAVIASAAMGLGAWAWHGIASAASMATAVSLFSSVTVAVLIYFVALWWLGEIKADEKQGLFRLWDELRAREAQAGYERRR
jgi:O-antigen/teichoic acid export membrane protein